MFHFIHHLSQQNLRHVTRMQTIIKVIKRSKKRLRKRQGKNKKRSDSKKKQIFISHCYSLITLHTLSVHWFMFGVIHFFDSHQITNLWLLWGIYCMPSSTDICQDRIHRNKDNFSRFLVWKWLVSSKAHIISYSLSWDDIFVYFGKDWLWLPKYLALSVVTQLALLAACTEETRT